MSLNILHNYTNGLMSIPVIIACQRNGLFDLFEAEDTISFDFLIEHTSANSGHLRTALVMLETLNWITSPLPNHYSKGPDFSKYKLIPDGILDLLDFQFRSYLESSNQLSLKDWFSKSADKWGIVDQQIVELLDGLLVIPLFIHLHNRRLSDMPITTLNHLLQGVNDEVQTEIASYFQAKGWLRPGSPNYELSEIGSFLLNRIYNTAILYSYLPMIRQMDPIIFGDCELVFSYDQDGHESHIDRTLNVIGSGFQHGKFFNEIESVITDIFNQPSLSSQPKYIADMGCGDGTLLNRIYQIIRTKTIRGQHLDKHPILLIGVDFNERALVAAKQTLAGLHHITIKGDIGDPVRLIHDLQNLGIRDTNQILHVRSFLDHDRTYQSPSSKGSEVWGLISEAVFVAKDGKEIPRVDVYQNLIEHLQKWSAIETDHGFIILEVHSLNPSSVRNHINNSESFHFDAYHRFSQQLLIEADNFLLAAAAAGLFAKADYSKKHPRTLPYTRITLNYFERRDYIVRFAAEKDIQALLYLEQVSWDPFLCTSEETLRKRIQRYPRGQLVVEMNQELVGVVYSQRIMNREALLTTTITEVEDLHDPSGAIVQLLSIHVLPEFQNQGIGDQLLEFMLQLCTVSDGIQQVLGISRCRDYQKNNSVPYSEYIHSHNETGFLKDPILRFHQIHGAQIERLIPHYRPFDHPNEGNGVLISYDPVNRINRRNKVGGNCSPPAYKQEHDKKTLSMIEDYLKSTISLIIGEPQEYSDSIPLMELGLDSADLIELNEHLKSKFNLPFGTTFFFKYNTVNKITNYLLDHLTTETSSSTIEGQSSGEKSVADGIAIIGASCRLPGGANTIEGLWTLLVSGHDAVTTMGERWTWPNNIDPMSHHKGIDKGGFLNSIDTFDPMFFRIPKSNVEWMDPQQRLLLELSWECLENSGYPSSSLAGSQTGVYIGASGSDYQLCLNESYEQIDSRFSLGSSVSLLANRISYFYNLLGPSIVVDTACSSSLVAVHQAVQAINNGECNTALVGAIHLMCHPSNSISYYKAGMLSPDGKCKTFDRDANGYVRGEGGVMLLLKPVKQALEDGDSILAVIKGTAVNHGGQASGLTVPNPTQQSELIRKAIQSANIRPEWIGYIEAHGTGTSLGDPIEVEGLLEAFSPRAQTPPITPSCGIGSIKTNIGHLEAAAGLAGLLKVALSLKNKVIPASLHYKTMNSQIQLADSPFYVVDRQTDWKSNGGQQLRYGGVSSFGSGGTNAHVILEEGPKQNPTPGTGGPAYLFVFSAKTNTALLQKESDMIDWIHRNPDLSPMEVSAALLLGRDHFKFRSAYVAKTLDGLQQQLQAKHNGSAIGTSEPNEWGNPSSDYLDKECAAIINILAGREYLPDTQYIEYLLKLANMYQQQSSISKHFFKLYKNVNWRQVQLPSYPFSKERFWVKKKPVESETSAQSDNVKGVVAAVEKVTGPAIQELVFYQLLTIVSQLLNTDRELIDGQTEFGEYGFDSILFLQLSKQIEDTLSIHVTPALFFEHSTLDRLSAYFTARFGDSMNLINKSGIIQSPASCEYEPIAIIGVSGLFPMAAELDDFWENLVTERDCISPFPIERWKWSKESHITETVKAAVKWGGFIEGIDQFDPLFFGISPKEAEFMDPQQRLIMMYIWKAIEDAGYSPLSLSDTNTAIFIGMMNSGYNEIITNSNAWLDGHSSTSIIPSIGPNRMSYFLNLHGPSEPIETACSSSLVAINRAVECLHKGTSESAIAGGVNTLIVPEYTLGFTNAGMLSEDGRCKTFSAQANGYVRGEGVGMVYLKKLSAAERDGDHIYAVIRGSAVNHGGRANSLTAPNPRAQSELLISAYRKANIDPRTVTYIETHGTGTELGDPIEINALKSAFKELYRDTGSEAVPYAHCGLGSVKSNIGHLELAAGIAGVIKVILQLKNKKIVKSLHSETVNPYIQLEDSPFYIVQHTQDWEAIKDAAGTPLPRRAGVSSFGVGGVNAHLILEEYIPAEIHEISQAASPYYFVLSARDKGALKKQCKALLSAIRQMPAYKIADVAYTLQTGRTAMEERLLILAQSFEELVQHLEEYLMDLPNPEKIKTGCFYPKEKGHKPSATGIQERDPLHWLQGHEINWRELYETGNVKRISLPTYPFSTKSYWLQMNHKTVLPLSQTTSNLLHPMVHRNTSTLHQQRYSSTFTGKEYYLSDHVVNEDMYLPGVAYLEMMWTTLKFALDQERIPYVSLKDIVWIRPFTIGDSPKELHIRLVPQQKSEFLLEIYSTEDTPNSQVHAHAYTSLGEHTVIPPLDIKGIRNRCSIETWPHEKCYRTLEHLGFHYSNSFRGMEELWIGSGEALARLTHRNRGTWNTPHDILMHPGIMDSALQACVGLFDSETIDRQKPVYPFSAADVEIIRGTGDVVWAYIQRINGSFNQFTIILCDVDGNTCIRIKDLVFMHRNESNPADRTYKSTSFTSNDLSQSATLMPIWKPTLVDEAPSGASTEGRILVIGGTHLQQELLSRKYPCAEIVSITTACTTNNIARLFLEYDSIDHIVWIAPPTNQTELLSDEGLIEAQQDGLMQVYRIIKALLDIGYDSKEISLLFITQQTQLTHPEDLVYPHHAGVHGLAGVTGKEFPNWLVTSIDLEYETDIQTLNIHSLSKGSFYSVRNEQFLKQYLVPFDSGKLDEEKTIYRQNGTYVVIGGAGGIGEVWSEYMIRRYGARIIWIGRRKLDEEIGRKVNRLSQMGTPPTYITADASDKNSLENAYKLILKQAGTIHGVVHSAITMLDSSLTNMEEDQFVAALTSKIDVSVRIAQVFGQASLDFILFFSSLNSFIMAPGQSNYVAGCLFKDSFAHRLSQEWPCRVRNMNWGYWGSVGIVASDNYRERMARFGLESISPNEGMEVLEDLLNGPLVQTAFLKYNNNFSADSFDLNVLESSRSDCMEMEIGSLRTFSLIPPWGDNKLHVYEPLDQFLVKMLWGQLHAAGFLTGDSAKRIMQRVPYLTNTYQKWLYVSFSVLERNGYLDFDGSSYTSSKPIPNMQLLWNEWETKKASWILDPDLAARVKLSETALRALPDLLAGTIKATEILFPDGTMDLVKDIYTNNPTADYYNQVLADAVEEHIKAVIGSNNKARIRILEVGAGTGGTSVEVLRRLRPYSPYIQEYCYTDISKAFLNYAEKAFKGSHPYLICRTLNVEEAFSQQGIDYGEYDLLLGANVLHATKNMKQTLLNCKSALKNNGLLLLNELVSYSLFAHVTFGLLDGWWLYEDSELRIPGSPCLTEVQWSHVLHEAGFHAVTYKADNRGGQNIIISQNKGTLHSNTMSYDELTLRSKCMDLVTKTFAESVRLTSEEIDPDKSFEHYGVDSILVVQITNRLEKSFGKLSKTLLFENQTIHELVACLCSSHKDALLKSMDPDRDTRLRRNQDDNRSLNGTVTNTTSKPMHTAPSAAASHYNEIAIIGLAGRYPGANNMDEFWSLLKEGRSAIVEIPKNRWDWSKYYSTETGKKGACCSKWGGFIEGAERFDSLLFQISPAEAIDMDPQERVFLEVAYECMEDAGYTSSTLSQSGKIGVFVGVMHGNYNGGGRHWSIANRVSYSFNFNGPSLAVDTACSSSLTAIHLACESIQSGSSDCAIAGGVNLILHPDHMVQLSELTMLSPNGQCRSFGHSADGFVDGEGVGAIILKPLYKALADGDHIYGVIKGSMINAGGKTRGYTVPNPIAQSKVIEDALQRAKINPRAISYVEAHGTGTVLGDPIEVRGLSIAYQKGTSDTQYCSIGSVKTNIGHCESAAGIAALTKVLLQMKYGQLAPSLHSSELNPDIEFTSTPFFVQQKLTAWNPSTRQDCDSPLDNRKYAGISSFGAGGANAHLIISEHIQSNAANVNNSNLSVPALIVLSAKSTKQLRIQAERLLKWIQLQKVTNLNLSEAAYTYQTGREHFDERLAIIAPNTQDLMQRLEDYLLGRQHSTIYHGLAASNKGSNLPYGHGRTEDLIQLASLWVEGYQVDWFKLYEGNPPSKISLPTYPFDSETYPIWKERRNDGSNEIGDTVQKSAFRIHDLQTKDQERSSHLTLFPETSVSIMHAIKARVNQEMNPGVHHNKITTTQTKPDPISYFLEITASYLGIEASSLDSSATLAEQGIDLIMLGELVHLTTQQFNFTLSYHPNDSNLTLGDFLKKKFIK